MRPLETSVRKSVRFSLAENSETRSNVLLNFPLNKGPCPRSKLAGLSRVTGSGVAGHGKPGSSFHQSPNPIYRTAQR